MMAMTCPPRWGGWGPVAQVTCAISKARLVVSTPVVA